jgi:hypothetical protein
MDAKMRRKRREGEREKGKMMEERIIKAWEK